MEGLYEMLDPLLVTFTNRLAFTEKGEKKRICIRDGKIAMVDVHRVSRDGRASLTLCKGERQCKYCKRGYLPSRRYGLRVFEYVMTEGKIDLRLIPWVFGQDKLDKLIKFLKQGKPMRKTDWMLTCTNPKFQGFSILPAKECFWLKNETLKAKAVELSKAVQVSGLAVLKSLVDSTLPEVEGEKKGRQTYQPPPEPPFPPRLVEPPQLTPTETATTPPPPPPPPPPEQVSEEVKGTTEIEKPEPESPEGEVSIEELLGDDSVVEGTEEGETPIPEEELSPEDWEKELDQILEGS